MRATITRNPPDDFLDEARARGLLQPGSLDHLLEAELRRRRAAADLDRVLDRARSQPGEPMSEADVAVAVKVARRERGGPGR